MKHAVISELGLLSLPRTIADWISSTLISQSYSHPHKRPNLHTVQNEMPILGELRKSHFFFCQGNKVVPPPYTQLKAYFRIRTLEK